MSIMLKILCRAQNVVYNVVSISGYELVGYSNQTKHFFKKKNLYCVDPYAVIVLPRRYNFL